MHNWKTLHSTVWLINSTRQGYRLLVSTRDSAETQKFMTPSRPRHNHITTITFT